MRKSPRHPYLPLALFVFALLLLVSFESGVMAPVEDLVHYVVDPLQRGTSLLFEAAGGIFRTVGDVQELQAEVTELRARVDDLTVENVRLREYKAELEQLRALLNFSSEFPVSAPLGADVVGLEKCQVFPCGDVVGADPNPYLRFITINVGTLQGARVGDSVVSGGGGFVGRIAWVGPRTARVQLLTDASSATAAILQGSRVTGLVEGQPDGTLVMGYIPLEEEVPIGDTVLTSGLGGFMPKGLVVGQVASAFEQESELFLTAVVRPAVDVSKLETVLVITSFETVPVAESEPDA
jgi:rod shape-determining protein MreC